MILMTTLFAPGAVASDIAKRAAPPDPPGQQPLPDMALLEYLAELVEVDGELVGPLDMAAGSSNNDTPPYPADKKTPEVLPGKTLKPQEDKNQ